MALIVIPNAFSPNTVASSSAVNANFNYLAAYLNTANGSIGPTGYIILPGSIYLQWVASNSVVADGSAATALTWPIIFPNACFGFVPVILNAYQTNTWETGINYDSPSTTGGNINVYGAPTGSTVSTFTIAIGN